VGSVRRSFGRFAASFDRISSHPGVQLVQRGRKPAEVVRVAGRTDVEACEKLLGLKGERALKRSIIAGAVFFRGFSHETQYSLPPFGRDAMQPLRKL